MKFSWKHFRQVLVSLLLVGVASLMAARFMGLGKAVPSYDLLFSIDFNDAPYADPASTGIVIRVERRKANVVITGKTRKYLENDKPALYVCEAATGILHEIHIPIRASGYKLLPGDVEYYKFWGGLPVSVSVPKLASLTIDSSSVAPNGYSFPGVDFGRSYEILDIMTRVPYFAFAFGSALKDDAYKKCLEQSAGHQAGLTVHFIGWIIP